MTTPENSAPSPAITPGQIVGGKWRIVAPIGRGGMGTVFEGQNISIGKRVALKFIDAEFARHPDIATRFQREAEAASMVESAHIVHIFDSGTTDDGIPYIVMELLRGEDLRARIRRLQNLPAWEAVHIVAQILRGLHRAHEAGIVHRDLKPDNIFLVDRDDDPLFAKIVDFGISKVKSRPGAVDRETLTRQGIVLGTPCYMSPEQAQGLPDLDLRTDLWSVGAILFECLAGLPPYRGDTYEQIIISICTTDSPDVRSIEPTLPTPLAAFVKKALARDKTQRFQSAKEMLGALHTTGVLAASPNAVTPPPLSDAVEASSAPRLEVGTGGTRVSWSTAEPRAITSKAPQAQEAHAGRARAVRRRGLVVLGALVALAAFVLTFGLLRAHASRDPARPPVVAANAAAQVSTSVDLAAAEPRSSVELPAAVPAPSAAAPSAGPPSSAVSKSKKGLRVLAGAPTPGASPPRVVVPPPAPAAAPAQPTGVAGGLQIKTTYP